ADTSDAAERQSDKAWGFEPQVAESLPVCALKGHREVGFFLHPSGRKINNNPNLGFKTPGFITLPLCGI
ncbi:MAG: hypothetical protein GY795_30175, partial [Desulfobacterales bacterium]|nr:hypothetical protein [Desulfobacterales bacterium]